MYKKSFSSLLVPNLFKMMISILCVFLFFSSTLFAYDLQTDAKNAYFTDGHFRVIVGIDYKDRQGVLDYVQEILSSAQKTWQTEVDTLGFIQPRHSDIKKIDIYIGNLSAYNYETENFATISSNYAGWAMSYPSDDTPFFLLNNTLSLKQLEVTIAHEFFHTIQFTYFDETKISDEKWFKNIWWLEATAVLMEDEVFDDVNDYIQFLNPFFEDSYINVELYDGSHEYATAIYAKYLKERFGLDIVKKTFQRIETSGDKGYFEIIDDLLKEDYNTTLNKELLEFAKWCADPKRYFEEGNLYPSITHFTKKTLPIIEKGGVALVDNIDQNWSMISLPNNFNDVPKEDIDYIWSYDDGNWKINLDIKDYEKITKYTSKKAYWVKSKKSSYMYYTSFDKSDLDVEDIHKGWNFLSFSKQLDPKSLSHARVIWSQQNSKWKFYTNDIQISDILSDMGYGKITTLYPYTGYWLLY